MLRRRQILLLLDSCRWQCHLSRHQWPQPGVRLVSCACTNCTEPLPGDVKFYNANKSLSMLCAKCFTECKHIIQIIIMIMVDGSLAGLNMRSIETIEIKTQQPTINCDQGFDLPVIYSELILFSRDRQTNDHQAGDPSTMLFSQPAKKKLFGTIHESLRQANTNTLKSIVLLNMSTMTESGNNLHVAQLVLLTSLTVLTRSVLRSCSSGKYFCKNDIFILQHCNILRQVCRIKTSVA